MAIDPAMMGLLGNVTSNGPPLGAVPGEAPLPDPTAPPAQPTNPFLRGVPLDGSTRDATGGRGWADDADPTPLRRTVERYSGWMRGVIADMQARAAENFGFDQVRLSDREQLQMELGYTSEELEQQAALWGPEAVQARRQRSLGGYLNQQEAGGAPR